MNVTKEATDISAEILCIDLYTVKYMTFMYCLFYVNKADMIHKSIHIFIRFIL